MKNIQRTIKNSTFVLALGVASASYAANGPNVATNGGFEDGMDGWTILNQADGHGGLNYQGRNAVNPSADGGNNFGLQTFTGRYDTTSITGISQTITGLTPGHDYTLRFYTTASDFIWTGENEYWKVTFGTHTLDGVKYGPPPATDNYYWDRNWNRTDATRDTILADFRWVATNLTFTATSETQTLTFHEAQSLDTPWNTDATPYATPAILLVDGISLRDTDYTVPPAVPEPSTASLGLMGLAVVGFLVTRRRRPS